MADADEDLFEPQTPAGDEGANDQGQSQPEGEDEVLIGFEGEGDAPSPGEERDNSVIRELRARNREQARELEAFRRQQQPQKVEVGEEPTLAACDYDEDKFKDDWRAWNDRKAQAARQEADASRTQQLQQEAWNKRLGELETQKGQLGVKDYDQAADEVRTTFNEQQQAMIVRAAKNPALMIYALGKSPAKAAELAKITDPVDFIAEVARLEGKTTMTTQRKAAPSPEQIVRGSAPLSKATDKELERLEREAERTGNRTKVVQYKRRLREAAQAKR